MNQPSEKKGIWGSIKGAFVEDVPDRPGEAREPPPRQEEVAHQLVPPPAPAPAVDAAARQRLEAAIVEAAPPGYAELQEVLSSLSDSIPDDAVRWKAALKLVGKHGHTVEALLGDFDKCMGILEAKNRQFNDETQAQIKKKVGGRQASIADLDVAIAAKRLQKEQLDAEIVQLSEKRASEAGLMASDESKILSVEASFHAAYKAVYAQLTDRREKLSSYGKDGPR